MIKFRITFTGAKDQLYTRRLWKPAVPAQEAVEFKPAVYADGKWHPEIEAKEAVRFTPAEYKYFPFIGTFEFETDESGYNNLDSFNIEGKKLFEHWLTHENGISELGEAFNILVEKEAKSFSVSYDKRFDADIDAELAAENNLETVFDVELWLENNGDGELDYQDDTGEVNNIDVTEDSDEFIEVEWNG